MIKYIGIFFICGLDVKAKNIYNQLTVCVHLGLDLNSIPNANQVQQLQQLQAGENLYEGVTFFL